MIYQVAPAVTVIVLFLALMWGGGLYYEREQAREELEDLREDLKEVSESRDRWQVSAKHKSDELERGVYETADLMKQVREFKHCFESAEKERDDARKERDAYKRAKSENDERFMIERDDARAERDSIKASYTEALCRITDLDNLVSRIENAPSPDNIKGSYRITAIRGPYKKTRYRLARRAARAARSARRGATA